MANQPPGLNGINILGYMGVNPSTPTNYKTYNRSPTTNDSMNFKLGDHWEWQSEQRLWILVALIGGQATWKEIIFGAANEFRTNDGTAFPLAGVLNILGDEFSIITQGAGNTITIIAGPQVATEYTTDEGIARPALGNLFVHGGPNITTEAPINLGDELKVNLNTSIQQPATTADGTAGVYSLGVGTITETRFMYSRPATSTFLGSASGNLGVSNAANNTGIGAAALNGITTGAGNTAVGSGALLSITTADDCTSIGAVSQANNVDSDNNTSIGSNSLGSLTGGAGSNNAFGYQSLANLTTGSQNTAMGFSLNTLLTGTNNTALGDGAGNNYTGTESSNIMIANAGVVGEDNVIRIGTDGVGAGEQDACYIAGIYGRAIGGNNAAVVIDDTGKLGTGVADNKATFGVYVNTTLNNVTGAGARTTVLFDTVQFDTAAGFNLATGEYTIPFTGIYLYTASILFDRVTGAMIEGQLFAATGALSLTLNTCNIGAISTAGAPAQPDANLATLTASWLAPQTVGDVVYLQVELDGGAGNTAGISGLRAANITSYWNATLVGSI